MREMSNGAIRVLLGMLMALYPLAVYLGLKAEGHAWLGAILIGFGALRLCLVARNRSARASEYPIPAALILLGAVALLVGSVRLLLFYPCLMSVGALSIFALSMVFPPTLIERVARLREPKLSSEGVRYCRRVNLVWCVFLAVNSVVATWTALQANERIWLFYNGFLSYVFMGMLFAGELAVRTVLQARRRSA